MKVCEGAEWVDASGSGDPRRSSLSSSSGGGRGDLRFPKGGCLGDARVGLVLVGSWLESRARPPTDVHRINQP
jgi:hypothetical protein